MNLYRCGPDVDGERLNAFLTASVEAQRWQTLRSWLVGWLAFLSMPLWVQVMWPHLFGGALRTCVLAAWGALTVLFGVSLAMEIRWHRRLVPFRVGDEASDEHRPGAPSGAAM